MALTIIIRRSLILQIVGTRLAQRVEHLRYCRGNPRCSNRARPSSCGAHSRDQFASLHNDQTPTRNFERCRPRGMFADEDNMSLQRLGRVSADVARQVMLEVSPEIPHSPLAKPLRILGLPSRRTNFGRTYESPPARRAYTSCKEPIDKPQLLAPRGCSLFSTHAHRSSRLPTSSKLP